MRTSPRKHLSSPTVLDRDLIVLKWGHSNENGAMTRLTAEDYREIKMTTTKVVLLFVKATTTNIVYFLVSTVHRTLTTEKLSLAHSPPIQTTSPIISYRVTAIIFFFAVFA